MYTNSALASPMIINLPAANVSVSTRDQSFCWYLAQTHARTKQSFPFSRRKKYHSIVVSSTHRRFRIIYSWNFTIVRYWFLPQVQEGHFFYSFLFSARWKKETTDNSVGCCRRSLRANPRFLLARTRFSTSVHTPAFVYRKQVLSIRRGKINKWRSWCSPGPVAFLSRAPHTGCSHPWKQAP